jgi:hypothetical protein
MGKVWNALLLLLAIINQHFNYIYVAFVFQQVKYFEAGMVCYIDYLIFMDYYIAYK